MVKLPKVTDGYRARLLSYGVDRLKALPSNGDSGGSNCFACVKHWSGDEPVDCPIGEKPWTEPCPGFERAVRV